MLRRWDLGELGEFVSFGNLGWSGWRLSHVTYKSISKGEVESGEGEDLQQMQRDPP
jgi:hypothetical protein